MVSAIPLHSDGSAARLVESQREESFFFPFVFFLFFA